MTDEMRLLRAFIAASGYEIEEVKDTKRTYRLSDVLGDGSIKDGSIPAFMSSGTDYKVTKKSDWSDDNPIPQEFSNFQTKSGTIKYTGDRSPLNIEQCNRIFSFVQSHREDIINDVNDYGGLGFILDFIEGISP